MPTSKEFTPFDFFRLAKEAAEQDAELRIKLAKAGLGGSEDRGVNAQTSSTSRP